MRERDFMKRLPQEQELKDLAEELGIPIMETRGNSRLQVSDEDLQRRIMEYYQTRRGARLWIVAVIAAVASVISAATAIIAVCLRG